MNRVQSCLWAVLIFTIVLPITSFAEKWEKFGDRVLTGRIGVVEGGLNLDVSDSSGVGQEIKYKANARQRFFLAGAWNGFALSASFPLGMDTQKRLEMGDTTADDYQLRTHFEKFSVDLFYQNFKGYYIENSETFPGPRTIGGYILAPDLRSEHVGGNFLWNFNSAEFSMSAAFDQTERQIANGWSWLAGGGIHSNRFSSPASLVPTTESASYGSFGDIRSARIVSAMIGGGAGGCWVFSEKAFLAGTAMVYMGAEKQFIEKNSVTTEGARSPLMVTGKASLGYSGDKYLAAMVMQMDRTHYKIENAEIGFSAVSAGFIFGMRTDL